MGDTDYYVATAMFVCECACLYEQTCVVRASSEIFVGSESLKERFKLSISLEVSSYQVFKWQVSVASLQVKLLHHTTAGAGITLLF